MSKFYPATALIGGGTGALDSIDGAGLADGDTAFVSLLDDVTYGTAIFNYVLDDNSAAAESVPLVISPNANAGDKRWILTSSYRSWYGYDALPISWAADGTAAPDPLDDRITRPPYQYRTFAHDSTEDVNFVWFVPWDLSGTAIQFRVKYLVVTTAPSAVGVAFTLSGVSIGDNDPTNAAKGTPVTVTQTGITATLWDVLYTDWSGDVTVTDLAAGQIAELAFTRDHDHASDTYAQAVGVLAVEIRYVQSVTK